jgi:hypothetical protein
MRRLFYHISRRFQTPACAPKLGKIPPPSLPIAKRWERMRPA